jgi:MoxR-like ATPase
VTVDGVTRLLPDPFFLIATENPIEQEGTFPLPEAQLDRFAVKTTLGYPGLDDEVQIVEEQRASNPLDLLEPAVTMSDLLELRTAAQSVYIDRLLVRWLVELVRATRSLDEVSVGASVRANLALERLARAWAIVNGRSYVEPSDVQRLFRPVVAHRLVFDPLTIAEDEVSEDTSLLDRVWAECLVRAPAPSPDWDVERA